MHTVGNAHGEQVPRHRQCRKEALRRRFDAGSWYDGGSTGRVVNTGVPWPVGCWHNGAILGALGWTRASLVKRVSIGMTASDCAAEGLLVTSALYLSVMSVRYLWCCTKYIVLRRPVCQKSCVEVPLLTRVPIMTRETGGRHE